MDVREAFDRSAGEYDRTRRQLVPCFDEFYGAALEALPARRTQDLRLVDLGAGTGLLSLLVAAELPKAQLTLVDIAPQMLDVARERFSAEPGRFSFRVGDYMDVEFPRDVDCVVSALSIHHVAGAQKRELFRSVFAALRPGGVFINADQVAGADPMADVENRDQWLREVRSLGTREEDIALALDRMKEDRTSTVDDQLVWLSEVGFGQVRCSFQHTIFAVLVGRKPA